MAFEEGLPEYESELAKELGLTNSISVAVGAMIGGGIFTVLGFLAGFAGPGAVISFLIGGTIAFLTSFSYVRLSTQYPSSGGEFIFLRKSFPNPLFGNSVGMLLWLGYSVTISLYAFTFGIYTTEALASWTGNTTLFAVSSEPELISFQRFMSAFVVFTFMMINLRGVKETGTVQNLIVLFKVGVLAFFAIVGAFYINPDHYSDFFPNGVGNVFIGAAVIFVAYEGFQVIVNTVEEMKNPGRDVPLGMIFSVVIVAFIYMAVSFVAIGMADDPSQLDEAALIDLVAPWGLAAVLLITMGAIASTSSAINATLLGSSRLAYTMAEWKGFPEKLATISEKTRVPWVSIITTATISWIFTFLGDIQSIANAGSIIFLSIFFTVNITAVREFSGWKRYIPVITSIAIVFYVAVDIWFIFDHDEQFAFYILAFFIIVTILWSVGNQFYRARQEIGEFIPPAIPPPTEAARKRKEIPVFEPYDDPTSVYFENLDQVMVTVSGQIHETQAIQLAAAVADKYDIKLDLVNVGEDPTVFDHAKTVLGNNFVKYNRIQEDGSDVFEKLIEIYRRKPYQLIIMGSRRHNSRIDQLFNKSMTKRVADAVECSVIQVHPARYGQRYSDIGNLLVLMAGDKRDAYLARWAKILDSFGRPSEIYAYHFIDVPLLVPLDGVSEHPAILESAERFEDYVEELAQKVELPKFNPIILFGHTFSKSIVSATVSRAPDAILIGHTIDKGLRYRFRTPLAYQIMNRVDCVLFVFHTGKGMHQNGKY